MYLKKIKEHLNSKINTDFIEIYDDSKLHNYSHKKNKITHIRIIIISNDFFNISQINRHRIIFQLLKEIKDESIYSMTLYTYTLDEWKNKKKDLSFNKCCKKKLKK